MPVRTPIDEPEAVRWSPAELYRRDGDDLRCELCPHLCRLADGQTGVCKVRRRRGDIMETATFSTTVEHLDPVERRPLYHYRPGVKALTLGAPGCSFRCTYCVNYRISQYGRPAGQPWTAKVVDAEEVAGRAAAVGACVALSYTEPALALELTLALAAAGAEMLWKSNGFLTERAVERVAPHLAAVNIDVKAADDDTHRALTGAPLGPVLRTVAALRAAGTWVEVSTPLIPGTSADPEQLARIAASIAAIDPAIPWHLLRFTPTFKMAGQRPTHPDALAVAVEIGRRAGLRYVYVERALGPGGRRTDCPGCAEPVVLRGIWSTEANLLRAGACAACGTTVEGRW